MTRLISLDQVTAARRSVALGFFDGVHEGHRRIISRAVESAKEKGLVSAVFTFVNFPKPGVPLITTLEEKRKIVETLGADELVFADFTAELRNMEPEAFFEKILGDTLGACHLVSGEDYTFGRMAKGDSGLLLSLSGKKGTGVEIVPDVINCGRKVSSSAVRELLKDGSIDKADELLGGDGFFYEGKVVEGKRLGRTLGFPTINLRIPEDKIVVKRGVYQSLTVLPDGRELKSISNVGLRPTVENSRNANCETYIYGFDEDLYGCDARVRLLKFIREEKAFESPQALRDQVEADKEKVANLWEINIIVN